MVDLEVGDEEVQQVSVVIGEERWIAGKIGAASWWIGHHRQSPGTLFSLSLLRSGSSAGSPQSPGSIWW